MPAQERAPAEASRPSCKSTAAPRPPIPCKPTLQKGERVGIWAPNCAEWAVLQFAAAKAGAILVSRGWLSHSHAGGAHAVHVVTCLRHVRSGCRCFCVLAVHPAMPMGPSPSSA